MISKNEQLVLGFILKFFFGAVAALLLVDLLKLFLPWSVILTGLAVLQGGLGIVAYRAFHSASTNDSTLLSRESTFEDEMARLDAEDRVLDRLIGL